MAQERIQKTKSKRTKEEAPTEVEQKPGDTDQLKADLDAIIDEIDETLTEAEAAATVKSYIQKGGQASDTPGWTILETWSKRVRNVRETIRRLSTGISTGIRNIRMNGRHVLPAVKNLGFRNGDSSVRMPALRLGN